MHRIYDDKTYYKTTNHVSDVINGVYSTLINKIVTATASFDQFGNALTQTQDTYVWGLAGIYPTRY